MRVLAFTVLGWLCLSYAPKKSYEDLVLTKQNMYQVIKEMEIDHPDIVYAQAILESGDLKSRVCRVNNNLFGMKVASKRQTTAINKKGYAKYVHWVESVRDYKLYQDYVTKNKNFSRSQYLSILAKRYSETADYVSRLNRVLKENKAYIQN